MGPPPPTPMALEAVKTLATTPPQQPPAPSISGPPTLRGRRDFYPVLIGGVMLTVVAGFTNATFLSGIYGRAVSHMTGPVTRIATSLFGHDGTTWDVYQYVLVILSYLTGSLISGLIVGSDREFKRVRAYGVVLIMEAISLFFSVFVTDWNRLEIPTFFAAFGMGLQNGLVTTFSSAIIRTTHVTGLVTDIAVLLGQLIRYYVMKGPEQKGLWKLKIFIPLLVGFFTGAVLGVISEAQFGQYAMLFPASFVLLIGLAHVVFRTIAMDNVKKRGLQVDLLDADSAENPGYFAVLVDPNDFNLSLGRRKSKDFLQMKPLEVQEQPTKKVKKGKKKGKRRAVAVPNGEAEMDSITSTTTEMLPSSDAIPIAGSSSPRESSGGTLLLDSATTSSISSSVSSIHTAATAVPARVPASVYRESSSPPGRTFIPSKITTDLPQTHSSPRTPFFSGGSHEAQYSRLPDDDIV